MKKKFTEREKLWIKEYFKTNGNASKAARLAYGGSPGACRVKGHRKRKKLEPTLIEIAERGFDKMECREMNGIDFYFGNLEREEEEEAMFWVQVGGYKGFFRLIRKMR